MEGALLFAAANNDAGKVALLLSQGARVDVREHGFTPLLVAAQLGHTEVCKLLLKTGKANVKETTPNGFTPLLLAAHDGNTEVCKLLLDMGNADIEETASDGNSAMNQAARQGHASTVALLLSKGAKVDIRGWGWTPLLAAAQRGHTLVCELLLEKSNADIEESEPRGNTALNLAAHHCHVNTVALLLSKGAQVDTRDKLGFTPLLSAAQIGHIGVCELLLVNGCGLEEREPDTQYTALHYAAIYGYQSLLQLLLLSHKANVCSVDKLGGTPLHLASQEGHIASVETLLQAGADPLLPNKKGALPIHLAANDNHPEVVKVLIEQGGCSPDQVTIDCTVHGVMCI